ncbi:MAG: protein kinase [Acidobacteriota bacterium]|nr:protein kinase [Acidobacteriota bacterium]
MIDEASVQAAFPTVTNVRHLKDSGQKVVFLCEVNGHRSVLKVIKALDDSGRTEREIAAVTKLHSAYVPQVFANGQQTVGGEVRHFIIEEFIDGLTFRDVLVATPSQSFPDVVTFAGKLLHACADFENVSLVHRDIKPENIMVGTDGKVWVIDFGLVRHLDLTALTSANFPGFMGTVGYAPREQFRLMNPDIRADLFAVGVVMYEALTGAHPWRSGCFSALDVIRKMESTDLPLLVIPADPSGEAAAFIASFLPIFDVNRSALITFEKSRGYRLRKTWPS